MENKDRERGFFDALDATTLLLWLKQLKALIEILISEIKSLREQISELKNIKDE